MQQGWQKVVNAHEAEVQTLGESQLQGKQAAAVCRCSVVHGGRGAV